MGRRPRYTHCRHRRLKEMHSLLKLAPRKIFRHFYQNVHLLNLNLVLLAILLVVFIVFFLRLLFNKWQREFGQQRCPQSSVILNTVRHFIVFSMRSEGREWLLKWPTVDCRNENKCATHDFPKGLIAPNYVPNTSPVLVRRNSKIVGPHLWTTDISWHSSCPRHSIRLRSQLRKSHCSSLGTILNNYGLCLFSTVVSFVNKFGPLRPKNTRPPSTSVPDLCGRFSSARSVHCTDDLGDVDTVSSSLLFLYRESFSRKKNRMRERERRIVNESAKSDGRIIFHVYTLVFRCTSTNKKEE